MPPGCSSQWPSSQGSRFQTPSFGPLFKVESVSCSVMSDSLRPHSPPGSSVHGISQARILEWVAIPADPGDRDQTQHLLHCRQILFCLNHQRLSLTIYKMGIYRTSLMVQWLRLCPSTAGGKGLIPGWGTKILLATQCGQKKKLKWRYKCLPSPGLLRKGAVLLGTRPGRTHSLASGPAASVCSVYFGNGWRRKQMQVFCC